MARRETIRYHERLYGERELFTPGSWLASPARFILEALEVIQPAGKTTVLDLGCGVGRHAIPIAKQFGPSATVHCVDLLASAVGRLREYAMRYGVADQITSEVCDLENLVLANAAYDALTSKTWDVEETFAGAQTRLKSLCMMVCARSPGVAAGVSP